MRRALGLVGAVAVAVAAPVAAQEQPAVERTAWYSAASGGGLAAPQPTTEGSDLRVSRALDTTAFATLLYRADGVRASLDLSVRDLRAVGTPDLVACPTVGAGWAAGGNQPLDAAPEVDCGASTAFGVLSEDGTTVSFALDGPFQVEPGTWSIAVLPTPSALGVGPPPSVPLPFTVDVVAPKTGQFTAEPEFVLPEEPVTEEPAPGVEVESGGASGLAPFVPGLEVPTSAGGAAAAPLLPSLGVPPPAAAGDAAAPAPALAQTRPAAVRPAAVQDTARDGVQLLALLALVGVALWVGRESALTRPGPQLLGGRARLAGAIAPVTAASAERPRGLGRFAKVRDAAPRRLR